MTRARAGGDRPASQDVYQHASAVVEPGARVGSGTRIWHFCHVMAGARIGERCLLAQGCHVGPGAVLGDGVRLQNHVSVFKGVTLEDDVFCGPGTVFTNVRAPRAAVPRKNEFEPIVVERGASLGANVTVICGVRIGAHALLGAGAVVTRNVPAYGLWLGNPARSAGWVSQLGRKLQFDDGGLAHCPESGQRYQLDPSGCRLVDPDAPERR